MNKLLLLLLLFCPLIIFAQSKKERKALEAKMKADQVVINNLKAHVQYLSNDELEGRKAGSKGEEMARDYIIKQFYETGLEPKGTAAFVQTFLLGEGRQIDTATHFILNENKLKLYTDYFPLAFSANKSAKGTPALDLKEAGEPWFADVKDWLEANKSNTNFDIKASIKKEADRIAAKGATALILYNSGTLNDKILFNNLDSSTFSSLPIVYLTTNAFTKYCSDRSALLDVDLNVTLKESRKLGSNIIAYLNNGAANTVVIGAHYDHLGVAKDTEGADSTSKVFNGADDNGSGTAALIELAKMLKNSTHKQNNYLFIAFSAKEMNMLGSNYWLKNSTLPLGINYMVNIDMIGRYDAARRLTIGGYGTSDAWKNIFASVKETQLALKIDSSLSNTSDHYSFYNSGIPVLYFFTGSHTDYRKPTDDFDKINYEGELQVVKLIQRLVEAADAQGKIAFTKVPDKPSPPSTLFTVSLGVIPDNNYSGKGFKIGGISPKRLADKIGLKAGDILLQLGDYKINEMNSYMQALSMFKKGDTTTLKVLRENDEKMFAVEF